MSTWRKFLTQRYAYPALLVGTAAVLAVEMAGVAFGAWPWWRHQIHSTLLVVAAVAAMLTAITRQIGPVQEAYRLGMTAGARQERERIEREQQHGLRLAVGAADTGEIPAVHRPPLTLIHRN